MKKGMNGGQPGIAATSTVAAIFLDMVKKGCNKGSVKVVQG
jgi:hypothetical protein